MKLFVHRKLWIKLMITKLMKSVGHMIYLHLEASQRMIKGSLVVSHTACLPSLYYQYYPKKSQVVIQRATRALSHELPEWDQKEY